MHYVVDHLDPNLPFWGAVQGLYIGDPTQATCPRACSMCGSYPETWARSHRSGTDISALKELGRAVGIDALKELARAVGTDNYLSEVWSLPIYLQYGSTTILYYYTTVATTTTTAAAATTTTTTNPTTTSTTTILYVLLYHMQY